MNKLLFTDHKGRIILQSLILLIGLILACVISNVLISSIASLIAWCMFYVLLRRIFEARANGQVCIISYNMI